MPVVNYDIYCRMLDRAREGCFAHQPLLRVEFPGRDCGWMHMHLT